MQSFSFGKRSKAAMKGIQPDLKWVLIKALEITSIDFTVLEGLRSLAQQRINIEKGVSWTMDSRHLTGDAVDLAPWNDGGIDWEDMIQWRAMGHAVMRASQILDVPLIWGALLKHGGDWTRQNDAGHFELKR